MLLRAEGAVECSECGHLHFEGVGVGYSRCPLATECDCPFDDSHCGDCGHERHEAAVCIVVVDRHSASQGDGEGECMCGASEADYRRWSLS